MIKISEFIKIIENLPLLLQYIVPGYTSIMIVSFALSKKINKKNMVLFGCLISYVLLSFISLMRIKWFQHLPNNATINSALAIILGVIISLLISIVSQGKWFKKLSIKVFHKTLNDDIWRDVFDLNNGSNLKVFLRDQDYYLIGHLKNYEEKGDDSWLALSAFAKFSKNTNTLCENEPEYLKDNTVFIVVRFSDIENIQIF